MLDREVVIDANFVIALVGNEEYTASVKKVYRLMREEKLKVYAPTFILVEVLNILIKKKKTSIGFAKNTLKRLKESELLLISLDELIRRTGKLEDIVTRYGITSYDALYILLAEQKKCKLLTADGELLKIKNLTIGLNNFVF